jgi:hypothetical protein
MVTCLSSKWNPARLDMTRGDRKTALYSLSDSYGTRQAAGVPVWRHKGSMTPNDARRAEVLEALAELYLRLNGYFCIRNFLQHRPDPDEFGLFTESDLLAIRMRHQEEVLENGMHQPNDHNLVLPGDEAKVDCVIAEVKEPSVEFNRPIRGADGPRRIADTLRMFGVFPQESFVRDGVGEKIASELHKKVNQITWPEHPTARSRDQGVSVRMVVFAPETAKHAKDRKHFDLQIVLDFARRRMRLGEPCAPYRRLDTPVSPWRGCTHLIVEVFDKSHASNEPNLQVAQFVEEVLALWDRRILAWSEALRSDGK